MPLTVQTIIFNGVNRDGALFVASQAILRVPGSSLSHTSTISGPSHALFRTADMTVWQLEHAPDGDGFALASGFGKSGQATSSQHVHAVSIDWHLKDHRVVSA